MDGVLFINFYTLKRYTLIKKQDSQTTHFVPFQSGMLLLKQSPAAMSSLCVSSDFGTSLLS